MDNDTAIQLREAIQKLSDRIDNIESGAKRPGRTGTQVRRYCRWTTKDGVYYVAICGPKINSKFDHEKTLANKLSDVAECERFMKAADIAIDFALEATKGE